MKPKLRNPLCSHVFERGRVNNGEHKHEDVCDGVKPRPRVGLVFGARSIPQSQINFSSVARGIDRIIIENSGNVILRKRVCLVNDQQQCLAFPTRIIRISVRTPVPNHETSDVFGSHKSPEHNFATRNYSICIPSNLNAAFLFSVHSVTENSNPPCCRIC